MKEYQCNDCKKIFKVNSYKTKNRFVNAYLCYPCSCKYNNLYWTKEKREEVRVRRVFYNKYILNNIIKNKSIKEKRKIAEKKRNTFYNRTEQSRKEINKRRVSGFERYNLKRSLLKRNLPDYSKMYAKRKYFKKIEWENIRNLVFKNCNYICQVCEKKVKLEVHHIVPFLISKKHKYLIGVCKKCHCKLERLFENSLLKGYSITKSKNLCLKQIKGSSLWL